MPNATKVVKKMKTANYGRDTKPFFEVNDYI